jgi:hypothetical protein
MSVNDILDGLITSATADKNTLNALIAQLQHTTITSSDDELYDAPTFNDTTGIWMLGQSTANVDGLFVGCYKLPIDTINSLLSDVTVGGGYMAPSSPTAPASVTIAGGSPVDLAAVTDLEGRSFNSFCIRNVTALNLAYDSAFRQD